MDETVKAYEKAGITDNRIGYGDDPVLLAVDIQRGFTDPESVLGRDMTSMVERANELIDAARGNDVPIVFTKTVGEQPDGSDFGVWIEKFPTLDRLIEGQKWVDLDERLDRREGDYVLSKRQASCFHETELPSVLATWGIDTVIMAGCTTSGCIRATAIDACAHGYRGIVSREGVMDRADDPHDANLFDIDAKYGDVRPQAEVVDYLESV